MGLPKKKMLAHGHFMIVGTYLKAVLKDGTSDTIQKTLKYYPRQSAFDRCVSLAERLADPKNAEPSETALDKAAALAIHAARHDTWMHPCVDEHDDEEDYGNFTQAHQDGWEQTAHFDQAYRDKLMQYAADDAVRFEIYRDSPGLMFHEGFYIPLKERFWEVWEEKIKMYPKWEKHRAKLAKEAATV